MKYLIGLSLLALTSMVQAVTVECIDSKRPERKITAVLSDSPKKMKYMKGDIRDLTKLTLSVDNEDVIVLQNIFAEVDSLENKKISIHLVAPEMVSSLEMGFEVFGTYTTGLIDDGRDNMVVIQNLRRDLKANTVIVNSDLAGENTVSGMILFNDVDCKLK